MLKRVAELKDGQRLDMPQDAAQQGVFVLPEGSFLGRNYLGGSAGLYLIVRLQVVNLTDKPVEFPASSMVVTADGRALKHEMWSGSVPTMSFRINGGRSLRLKDIDTPETIRVEPGQAAGVYGVFRDVPDVGPLTELKLVVGGLPQPVRCDLMARATRELAMRVERLGPRKCVGVISIGGRIDPINAHALVNQMDQLATTGATRIVLRFGRNAPRLDPTARTWLTSAAGSTAAGGRMRSNIGQYPLLPSSVQELHIGLFPGSSAGAVLSRSAKPTQRIHASDEAAITAALRNVYQWVSLSELLADIDTGNVLTREAAIRGGTGRLPARFIPRLLEFSESSNKGLQLAAIEALGDFPDAAALQKLEAFVNSDDADLAETATRALAESRYPAAQQALSLLLQDVSTVTRLRIARVLVEKPDSAWSDLYYQYAADLNSPLVIPAISALRQIGHPDLRQLLSRALREGKPTVRTEAFRALAQSSDAEDLKIALADTLQRMESEPPSGEMLNLLQRVACREATPLLIRHFETAARAQQRQLLAAIARTGDESIVPFFLAQYPKLDDSLKAIALNALQMFRPAELRDLAIGSLTSSDSSLVSTCTRILQDDGSPTAIAALGDELMRTAGNREKDGVAVYMIRALGALGTPEARVVLRRVQNGESARRRDIATNTLGQLQVSSPGYPYLREGGQLADAGKTAEAEKKYDEAIEVDPFLPEAFVRRGHLKMHADRVEEGFADFDRALALDPLHPIATSLRAIGMVVSGDIEGGLKLITDNLDVFRFDEVFVYNAACAYGEAIKLTPATAENQKKINDWKTECLNHLERCINVLHYDDVELLKTDPDLDPVRDTKRFQSLLRKLGGTDESEEDPEDKG